MAWHGAVPGRRLQRRGPGLRPEQQRGRPLQPRAYEQALERQPDLQPALDNQALVEQLLQQRQGKAEAQSDSDQAEQSPSRDTDGNSSSPNSSAQGTPGNDEQSPAQDSRDARNAPSNDNATGSSSPGDDDDSVTQPPQRPAATSLDAEQRQALEQWLREIPDNPAQLLRRKFWYEQQLHQEPKR